MVLDKSSIKELYDNRDIIAQIGNLENELRNMPDKTRLTQLYEYMVLFLNRYEYLMFEDKSAYIDAKHEFEVAPVYATNGPTYESLPPKGFVSKEMLDHHPFPHLDRYLDKLTLDPQSVKSRVTFDSKIDFNQIVNFQSNINANAAIYLYTQPIGNWFAQKERFVGQTDPTQYINIHTTFKEGVASTSGKMDKLELGPPKNITPNEGDILMVNGDQLNDGNLHVFGDFETNMIKCQYMETQSRPTLQGDITAPVVDNSFITLKDLKEYSPTPTPIEDKWIPREWTGGMRANGGWLAFTLTDTLDIKIPLNPETENYASLFLGGAPQKHCFDLEVVQTDPSRVRHSIDVGKTDPSHIYVISEASKDNSIIEMSPQQIKFNRTPVVGDAGRVMLERDLPDELNKHIKREDYFIEPAGWWTSFTVEIRGYPMGLMFGRLANSDTEFYDVLFLTGGPINSDKGYAERIAEKTWSTNDVSTTNLEKLTAECLERLRQKKQV